MIGVMTAPSGGTDWAAIRSRLDALPSFGSGIPELTEEESRVVLEERAQILAVPPAADGAEEYLELVVLELAAETYAVESRFVFEAFRSADLALLPGAEPPVVGITAWRGDLLTLLDLRWIMGLPAATGAEPRRVVVLGHGGPAFGILVDDAREILRVPLTAVQPLAERAGDGNDYLQGTTVDAVLVIAVADLIRTFT